MTEVRVTDPVTGASKGSKPERHDLVPPYVIAELARVYAMGAEKYSDFNYLRGFKWGLSVASAKRHIDAWLSGEKLNVEEGSSFPPCHHLAHAIWHLATLMTYERYGLGTDDRVFAWLEEGRPDGNPAFDDARPRSLGTSEPAVVNEPPPLDHFQTSNDGTWACSFCHMSGYVASPDAEAANILMGAVRKQHLHKEES